MNKDHDPRRASSPHTGKKKPGRLTNADDDSPSTNPSTIPTKPCAGDDSSCPTETSDRPDTVRSPILGGGDVTRPGGNVRTDRHTGQTYEGQTGISGETDPGTSSGI
jgi:hypothetical protein